MAPETDQPVPVTACELAGVLGDLLAAVLAAHPDPVHAAYPPIAHAIAVLDRYERQMQRAGTVASRLESHQ